MEGRASEFAREVPRGGHPLAPLLAPRSIAFIGASPRANTPGNDVVRMAQRGGFRGAAPADMAALAGTIARFSVLATELGDRIKELDVNPLIVGPDGALAVDALIVLR